MANQLSSPTLYYIQGDGVSTADAGRESGQHFVGSRPASDCVAIGGRSH